MNLNEIGCLLQVGREILKQAGVSSHVLDAEVLLRAAANISRVQILTEPQHLATDYEAAAYHQFLQARAQHMPVAYILQCVEFMSLDFYVNDHVLIPRPDTEILVERALEIIKPTDCVLELCTGSGCIAVSLAVYVQRASAGNDFHVTAVDVSDDALAIAKKNAVHHEVENCIAFVQADIRTENSLTGFDMLLANPPYIKESDLLTLDRNVKDYEPMLALDGGLDGLDFYRKIIEDSRRYLKPAGVLLFEIGYDQQEAVVGMLKSAGYGTRVHHDLAGHPRVIEACKKGLQKRT